MRRLAFLVATVGIASLARADISEPDFTQTDVVTIPGGNPQVTSMAWAPDSTGRLFVTGKNGEIWIVQNGAVLPQLFYQFDAGELVTSSECGLLSIAFDPAYLDNHYVYVFATLFINADMDIEQHIIRFTDSANMATNRTPIITGLPSNGANHDGGGIAFGPDGLIYWAVGNLGSGVGEGTNLMSPASKMGRASVVPGAPPPAGMYNDGAGPNWDYIYARGLRNPFTMTFHPVTGQPWVNIVGDSWEQVFVLAHGDHSGYPLENANPGQGNTTVSPVIAYPTGSPGPRAIGAGGAVRAGDIVTVTTSGNHGLRKGGHVTIADIDDISFNGEFNIAGVPSTTTFTYADPGGNVTSGNGTVEMADYGNVVLGGTFYDATQFPAAYRQNFFFGDFGDTRGNPFVRVETALDGSVARVNQFGMGFTSYIDASTGPDGALWIVEFGGAIHKVTYDAATVGLVISPQNLRIHETSRGLVGVSLSMMPAGPVTVTLTRTTGSTDVTMGGAAVRTLNFTTANWQTPQFVEVAAAQDADETEDTAEIEVTATSLATETVTVRVTDTTGAPVEAGDAGVGLVDSGLPGPDGGGQPMGNGGGCSCGVGQGSGGLTLVLLVMLGALATRRRS